MQEKLWLHNIFPVLKHFLQVCALSSTSQPNPAPTWHAGQSCCGGFSPGAWAELAAEPAPSPSSWLATTCLYCPSARESLSLACSTSAGKPEHTQNTHLPGEGQVSSTAPPKMLLRKGQCSSGARASRAGCPQLLTRLSFHFAHSC